MNLNQEVYVNTLLFKIIKKHINKYDFDNLLALGAPESEYYPEIAEIVSRISKDSTVEDIENIVTEVFQEYLDEDLTTDSHSKDLREMVVGLKNELDETVFKEGTMSRIELIHGSCADQKADAIVNAANRYLAAGGGICGAIFNKAGYVELSAACAEHKTPLKDGDAVITPSFGLENAKAIIHAVGPNFAATPDAFDALVDAYFNSLVVLKENGYHSISFPLISSGIFGGNLNNPARESARRCCEAVRLFVAKYPDYEVNVLLCAYSANEYEKAMDYFGDSAVKELYLSLSDPMTDLVKGKTGEDGKQIKVVKENGNNIVVRV